MKKAIGSPIAMSRWPFKNVAEKAYKSVEGGGRGVQNCRISSVRTFRMAPRKGKGLVELQPRSSKTYIQVLKDFTVVNQTSMYQLL